MANSKPRGNFAPQQTVPLTVEMGIQVTAIKLLQSLPSWSGDIKGIMPQFEGKCFDSTLTTIVAAAARLAQEGIDYEQTHLTLRLLGRRAIHVSVFVAIEYHDESLISILERYGELATGPSSGII